MFDIEAKEYLFMAGFGYKKAVIDASDKDGYINIKDSWGSDNIELTAAFMPDVTAHITIDGKYYFLTANEGDTRDGEDMIGTATIELNGEEIEFEGEEIRMGDLIDVCTCS